MGHWLKQSRAGEGLTPLSLASASPSLLSNTEETELSLVMHGLQRRRKQTLKLLDAMSIVTMVMADEETPPTADDTDHDPDTETRDRRPPREEAMDMAFAREKRYQKMFGSKDKKHSKKRR